MTDHEVADQLIRSIRPFIKSARFTGEIPDFIKQPRPVEFAELMISIYSIIQQLREREKIDECS